jgi:hypothetical protein
MTDLGKNVKEIESKSQTTNSTLAEILNAKPDDQVTVRLQTNLDQVRAAEFQAVRDAAEVRLY